MPVSGTVKWFDDDEGCGVVTRDGDGPDPFCHHDTFAGDGLRGEA